MHRLLIAIATVSLLSGWILSTTTPALPPPGTTTRVMLPVNQYLAGMPPAYAQGDLDATFEATPQSGGWIVRATFRPVGLTLGGAIIGNVSGKATGSIGGATGVSRTLFATKLNISGGSRRLFVQCEFYVDSYGVVWVQQYQLGVLTTGGGGPCTDC